MTTTTLHHALRERLAELREQEYRAHQALLVSEPCTYRHVRTHADWVATRARIDEVARMLEMENE